MDFSIGNVENMVKVPKELKGMNVFITSSGAWKLGGFGFAISTDQASGNVTNVQDFHYALKDYPSLYEGYVPMKFKRYYKKMEKSGEWVDHVTLQAATDKFEAKICLLTSFRDTCFIEIMPRFQPPKRELKLQTSFPV